MIKKGHQALEDALEDVFESEATIKKRRIEHIGDEDEIDHNYDTDALDD